MTEIKYVVVSDLHLGAENSLLTHLKDKSWQLDNSKPSPVLVQLISCLRLVLSLNKTAKKPRIIFNGDLVELALTTENQSGMAFQRFIELTMPEDELEWMFDREMLFIPGNHDHNLWETARYNYFIKSLSDVNHDDMMSKAIHITRMFDPPLIDSEFLTTIANRVNRPKERVSVRTMYPAFSLLDSTRQKCVVISHGHFIESMYSLMSTIDTLVFPDREAPDRLQSLEAQNYAWIDFFWSTLGRSGRVGSDLSLLYDKMQDPKEVRRLIDTFCTSISLTQKNFIVAWIERKVLEELMNLTVGKLTAKERQQAGILTPDALQGLHKYLEVYLRRQMEQELKSSLPKDITFLFGHTHKPFEQDMSFKGFDGDIKVFNSGGWVVDTVDAMPFHGGSVLLIDENLDTVSLQMYKEGKFNPTLEVSGHDEHYDDNPLYKWLSAEIDFRQLAWKEFEQQTEEEVHLRHKFLKEIIKEKN